MHLFNCLYFVVFFFFKQKTAYEMRISDWSSDVCSSDLYTNARLKADTDPNVGGLSGDRLPFTPKFNWNANVDYSWGLGGDTEAYVGASLRSLSKQRANFAGGDRKSTRLNSSH